jgi:hypothetical protein
MIRQEIFAPYARVALAAKQELDLVENKLKNAQDSREIAILKRQKGDLRHLIDRCFRQSGDFVPVHASKRVLEYCSRLQLGNVFAIKWAHQKKFEKQSRREKCQLKHEHKIPVSNLVAQLKKVESLEEAIALFESQEIVWILKEEDARLPRNLRPDPDKAYAEAMIEVVSNPNTIGHLFK